MTLRRQRAKVPAPVARANTRATSDSRGSFGAIGCYHELDEPVSNTIMPSMHLDTAFTTAVYPLSVRPIKLCSSSHEYRNQSLSA